MLEKLSWPLIWCVNVFQGIGHVKELEIHVYKDCQTMNQLKEN
jgi:hypothetical protein